MSVLHVPLQFFPYINNHFSPSSSARFIFNIPFLTSLYNVAFLIFVSAFFCPNHVPNYIFFHHSFPYDFYSFFFCFEYFHILFISCTTFIFYFVSFFAGTFFVTYSIAMILCGIPLFFQEVAIGQYLGSGGMTFVGQLVPILKGVGYATMTIVFLLDIYYCIIIAWTIYYLINTFVVIPDLPWSGCGELL